MEAFSAANWSSVDFKHIISVHLDEWKKYAKPNCHAGFGPVDERAVAWAGGDGAAVRLTFTPVGRGRIMWKRFMAGCNPDD
jgi:hypothetical protein